MPATPGLCAPLAAESWPRPGDGGGRPPIMTNATDDDLPADADAQTAREAALQDLREARSWAQYKVTGEGRIRDTERCETRIKLLRLVIQSCNAERRLLQDAQLDELAERLNELENAAANTDAAAEAWVSDA